MVRSGPTASPVDCNPAQSAGKLNMSAGAMSCRQNRRAVAACFVQADFIGASLQGKCAYYGPLPPPTSLSIPRIAAPHYALNGAVREHYRIALYRHAEWARKF